MSCRRHRDTLTGWDPAGDLPGETALHIDGCAGCRAAFDARFTPAVLPALEALPQPTELPVPASTTPLVPLAAALVAGAALFLSVHDDPPEPAHPIPPAAPLDAPVTEPPPAPRAPVTHTSPGDAASEAPRLGAGTTPAAEALVGRPPPSIDGAEWFFGQGHLDPDEVNLLIFWESWCHYCDQALLEIEGWHRALDDQGLNVIGFTTLSREVTMEEAFDHLEDMAEGGVSFANAYDPDKAISDAYEVRGIPSAALVHRGELLWRGHPSELDPEYLRTLAQE